MKKVKNAPYLFQITRRTLRSGEKNYSKQTLFLPNDDTLQYLCFENPFYTFWDEGIVVWRIKSTNPVTTNNG